MNHLLLSLHARCPITITEGLRLFAPAPLIIFVGIPRPTPDEVRVINEGRILHRFGVNPQTAWLTLHFYDARGLQFQGEVFFSAGKQPADFSDERLAEMRSRLPEGRGSVCSLILVDTTDQTVRAMRAYTWSRALSLAFLDAAELTRGVWPAVANLATDELLKFTNDELASLATVTFDLTPLEEGQHQP